MGQYLSKKLPVDIVALPVVTTKEDIKDAFKKANNDDECIGVITWMHTFSPSKMLIEGFKLLHNRIARSIHKRSLVSRLLLCYTSVFIVMFMTI